MKNMAKSIAENAAILFDNANAGFKAFEKQMLRLSSKEVFDRAFEINAKNEIHGYLCGCAIDDLDGDEIEVLVGIGDTVIDELYEYFLNEPNASIMFYSDITDWVKDYCQRGNEK